MDYHPLKTPSPRYFSGGRKHSPWTAGRHRKKNKQEEPLPECPSDDDYSTDKEGAADMMDDDLLFDMQKLRIGRVSVSETGLPPVASTSSSRTSNNNSMFLPKVFSILPSGAQSAHSFDASILERGCRQTWSGATDWQAALAGQGHTLPLTRCSSEPEGSPEGNQPKPKTDYQPVIRDTAGTKGDAAEHHKVEPRHVLADIPVNAPLRISQTGGADEQRKSGKRRTSQTGTPGSTQRPGKGVNTSAGPSSFVIESQPSLSVWAAATLPSADALAGVTGVLPAEQGAGCAGVARPRRRVGVSKAVTFHVEDSLAQKTTAPVQIPVASTKQQVELTCSMDAWVALSAQGPASEADEQGGMQGSGNGSDQDLGSADEDDFRISTVFNSGGAKACPTTPVSTMKPAYASANVITKSDEPQGTPFWQRLSRGRARRSAGYTPGGPMRRSKTSHSCGSLPDNTGSSGHFSLGCADPSSCDEGSSSCDDRDGEMMEGIALKLMHEEEDFRTPTRTPARGRTIDAGAMPGWVPLSAGEVLKLRPGLHHATPGNALAACPTVCGACARCLQVQHYRHPLHDQDDEGVAGDSEGFVPADQLSTLEEFNAQLSTAAQQGDRGRADRLWDELCCKGVVPDIRTLNMLLKCLAKSLAHPDEAEQLAKEVCQVGNFSPNATTYNWLAEARMRFEQLCG